MIIVFTARGSNWDSAIDPRFGRAEFLLSYKGDSEKLEVYDNRDTDNQAHGVGPQTVEKLYDLGANVLITGNGPGNNAAMLLKKSGIITFIGAANMTVREAFEAYNQNGLDEFKF
jgi:predicted Fe-Mo cluster-binding NifX family protein